MSARRLIIIIDFDSVDYWFKCSQNIAKVLMS